MWVICVAQMLATSFLPGRLSVNIAKGVGETAITIAHAIDLALTQGKAALSDEPAGAEIDAIAEGHTVGASELFFVSRRLVFDQLSPARNGRYTIGPTQGVVRVLDLRAFEGREVPSSRSTDPTRREIGRLAGSEPIILRNLARSRSDIETRLPGIVPIFAAWTGTEWREVEPSATSLIIDLDLERMTLVFRASTTLPGAGARVLASRHVPGQVIDWHALVPSPTPDTEPEPEPEVDRTITLHGAAPDAPDLPFSIKRPERLAPASLPPVVVHEPRRSIGERMVANASIARAERVTLPTQATPPINEDQSGPARSRPQVEPRPPPLADAIAIEVLFHDAALPGRLATHARWKEVLAEHPARAVSGPDRELGRAGRERASVASCLAHGIPSTEDDSAIVAMGLRDGVLTPPLVLLSGQLTLDIDDVARLTITLDALASLEGAHPAMRESLVAARGVASTPFVDGEAARVATSRLVTEAVEIVTGLTADRLVRRVDQTAMAERRYVRRRLLGSEHLRAILREESGAQRVVHMTAPHAEALTSARDLRARVLCEARPSIEEEPPGVAFFALALGRVVAVPATSAPSHPEAGRTES